METFRGHVQSGVDAETVAYILEMRTCFEDLRQVAGQLAGLLVLAAAGAKGAMPDQRMLETAAVLYDRSGDAIRRAVVTDRARTHHRHLERASAAIGTALGSARRSFALLHRASEADPIIDGILTPLREGYAQLQRASNELPGFDLVGLERACCAGPTGTLA